MLGRQSSGNVHPKQVAPFLSRIGGGSRKGPKLQALAVDLCKLSQARDHAYRVRVKPRLAIVEMLNQIIGRIADKWFRID